MKENIELFYGWCLERLPMALLKIAAVGVIVIIGAQVGIYHGRSLAAGEMAWEIAANELAMQELKGRIERAEREIKTYETLVRIIGCESSGRHTNVWGDNKSSFGILQFKKTSFNFLKEKMGLKNADWKSKEDQLQVGLWGIKNGYAHWWSCYEKGKGR